MQMFWEVIKSVKIPTKAERANDGSDQVQFAIQGLPFREAEKKMGAEISVKGNKGPSLSPMGSLQMPLSRF